MLDTIAGITRIRMLYLQLLYRCNFNCQHCFHGRLLKDPARYSFEEATAILDHFATSYSLEAVTFLGGEPLLYSRIADVCRYAKNLGLTAEICTNGHPGFRGTIAELAGTLGKLRVSLDGLHDTHDRIRKPGSFNGALDTIDLAVSLGITTGVTTTVTSRNIHEIVDLARLVHARGVTELKLHCLRLVGNARANPHLAVQDITSYRQLHQQIIDGALGLEVIYDSDLSDAPPSQSCPNLLAGGWLDRIESDPAGGLTVSCKAVGRDAHAFRWDKTRKQIIYEPRGHDEFTVGIPDVVYRIA